MTSAHFTLVPISSILFDDSERQRKELRGIEELMESIRNIGLINPPLITRDGRLIAGRRRLEALIGLGALEVPVQYADEIEPDRLALIELEENVKRMDLTWQEINRAIVTYHELKAAAEPGWTQDKTASALAMDRSTIMQHLVIAEQAKVSPELNIEKTAEFTTALGLARRSKERRQSSGMEELLGGAPPPTVPTAAPKPADPDAPPPKIGEVLHTDFREWLRTNQERFNFLHVDFPYGVDTGSKTSGQSATKRLGSYDDSEEVYWDLLELLCSSSKKLCEPQAHMLFWFSMRFYHETKTELSKAGWKVDPFPFIWGKSDNSGIIPDPNRGPRRGYECALFCSRGDRKIVRPVANIFWGANPRENHAHEKPQDMLQHFFRMIVDGSTRMLDPTCGSGSAVKAAEACGAVRCLGLEKNEEFAERARRFVAA